MKRFSAKADDADRIYTVGMKADNSPSATLSGTPVVTVELYDKSDVDDPSPSSMISGSPSKNIAAVVIEGQTVAIARAISQKLQGGLPGALYVVRFRCDQSDGQEFAEDVILPVSEYVPP